MIHRGLGWFHALAADMAVASIADIDGLSINGRDELATDTDAATLNPLAFLCGVARVISAVTGALFFWVPGTISGFIGPLLVAVRSAPSGVVNPQFLTVANVAGRVIDLPLLPVRSVVGGLVRPCLFRVLIGQKKAALPDSRDLDLRDCRVERR